MMPGVGPAVVDVHSLGVTLDVSRSRLNPMVDIKPQLLAARRTELFTVRATAPAYWRLTALDRFDGRRWSPSRPALHPRAGPAVAKNGLDPAAAGAGPCTRTSTSPPSTRRGSRPPTRRSASRRPGRGSTRRRTRW